MEQPPISRLAKAAADREVLTALVLPLAARVLVAIVTFFFGFKEPIRSLYTLGAIFMGRMVYRNFARRESAPTKTKD